VGAALLMGARQDSLARLFEDAGFACRLKQTPRIALQDLARPGALQDAEHVYRALGGHLAVFPLRPGPWDVLVDGIPVELDEERHFNRYRAITLASPLYTTIAGFDVGLYIRLCHEKEPDCVRAAGWRGNWTNTSCEKQFGPGGPERMLAGNGAPRWKQRAFYDFLKDLTILTESRPVVRFSVWEEVGDGGRTSREGRTNLGRLLQLNPPGEWRAEVLSLFRRRASIR
jgi:hypothetical protein